MCLGVPGLIRERWQDDDGALLARADFVGEERIIRLNYLPHLQVDDWTIVHAGFALTALTHADALNTIAMMRDVGLLDESSPTPVVAGAPRTGT